LTNKRLANPNSFQTQLDEGLNVQREIVKTTTMDENDAATVVVKISNPMDLDSTLVSTADSGYTQNVIQFLQKPYRIRSGNWSAASAALLHAIAMPEEMLALPIYANKVDGYLAFKATLVMKLQVNGNPFQQGVLIMYYIPQGQVTGMYPNVRRHDIRTISQLPHVKFDIACDTEAVLKIPYVSPTTHYNLIDHTGPIGTVYLGVFLQFGSGTGSNNARYTVWSSFEDIEIVTPTVPSSFYSQAGGDRIKRAADTSDKELSKSGAGPVESVFKGLASVSTALMSVPMLSSIAAPASWVSSALAKTAAHFGWSNPMDESPANRVRPTFHPFVNNSDVIDSSMPLALKVQNKVEVLPGFAGTDIDEMNLNFIASVPAVWAIDDWNTGHTDGTIIWDALLAPYLFRDTTTVNDTININTITSFTPCAFVSSLFDMYRGSIRLTFRFAKTTYHSGRLVLSYAPGYVGAVAPTIADTNYIHREVLDMREGNVFTFTIPYVSTVTWKRRDEPYGKVWLTVLNQLVAPDTVQNFMYYSIEVSMDADAEFAVPRHVPYKVWTTPASRAVFASQAGGTLAETFNPCALVAPNKALGNSITPTLNPAASKFCIGETVTSFLHLLKRSATFQGLYAFPTLELRPFEIGGYAQLAVGRGEAEISNDWISILAPLYAYNRGGIRLSLIPSDGMSTNYMSALLQPITNTTVWLTPADPQALLTQNGSFVPFRATVDSGLQVQIPSYNQLHSRLNRFSFDITLGAQADIYASKMAVIINTPSNTDDTAYLRRQAADDYSLGFFLGVPPMWTSSTLAP
jgi:hypothetical protein